MGKTPPAELVWEFHQQLRPWLQPAIEYGAAKALIGLGIQNPAILTLAFRAINGLIGWAAITARSCWPPEFSFPTTAGDGQP